MGLLVGTGLTSSLTPTILSLREGETYPEKAFNGR